MTNFPTDPFGLVAAKCTVAQVQELLRQCKLNSSEVRIGARQEDVINNLRDAVERHVLPIERVHELVQHSEENGDQHIFYFKPKSAAVASSIRMASGFAQRQWQGNWETKLKGFPNFDLKEGDYVWADFRGQKIKTEQGWIAKLYGHEYRLHRQREKEEGNLLHVWYEKLEERLVCVAKWNMFGQLELRVPRSESRKLIRRRLAVLWERLSPALKMTDFLPWDLSRVRHQLVKQLEENTELFTASDIELRDTKSGIARFSTSTEEENISDAEEREDAIQSILVAGGKCRRLEIQFDPDTARGVFGEQPLRVLIGGPDEDRQNEIVIYATTTPQAVDYVTNQLRAFDS